MYGRESDSDESEVSCTPLVIIERLLFAFHLQEGPDFDNPSFYPKPQQQQAATGGKLVSLKAIRSSSWQFAKQFLTDSFYRASWKWKLVLALGQILVKMKVLEQLDSKFSSRDYP